MIYLVKEAKDQLTTILQAALKKAFAEGTLPEAQLP